MATTTTATTTMALDVTAAAAVVVANLAPRHPHVIVDHVIKMMMMML